MSLASLAGGGLQGWESCFPNRGILVPRVHCLEPPVSTEPRFRILSPEQKDSPASPRPSSPFRLGLATGTKMNLNQPRANRLHIHDDVYYNSQWHVVYRILNHQALTLNLA